MDLKFHDFHELTYWYVRRGTIPHCAMSSRVVALDTGSKHLFIFDDIESIWVNEKPNNIVDDTEVRKS